MVYVLWVCGNIDNPFPFNRLIMKMDGKKHQHEQWDEYNDDPGTLQKLRGGNDQAHEQCGQRSQAIDNHAAQPAFVLMA